MTNRDIKEKLETKKSWNKKDLTNILSLELGISKAKAVEYINAFVTVVSDGLSKGKKITISDFGTFTVSNRSSFSGTHPRTGEPLEVSGRNIPGFKVGKGLKDLLNPHLGDTDE